MKTHDLVHTSEVPEEIFFLRANSKKIEEWFQSLPLFNLQKSCDILQEVLILINSLPLKYRRRFYIMEIASRQVHNLLPLYINKVQKQEGGWNAEALVGVHQLLGHLLLGYHLILNQYDNISWLARYRDQGIFATSAYRMFHLVNTLLHLYQKEHRPYPDGLWQQLVQLFVKARREGWHDDGIQPLVPSEEVETIEHQFQRLMLLSQLTIHRVGEATQKEIENSLDEWIGGLSWIEENEVGRGNDPYLAITPEDKIPPTSMRGQSVSAAEGGYYSMSQIEHKIRAYLDSIPWNENETRLESGMPISRQALAALYYAWFNRFHRSEKRLPCHGRMNLVFGIHKIMQRFAEPEDKAPAKKQENHDAVVLSNMPAGDIWHKQRAKDKSLKLESIENMPILGASAQVVDQSQHGYRLEINRPMLDHVGDLMLLSVSAHQTQSLAVVRWQQAMDHGHACQIGVQVLASNIELVELIVQEGENATEMLPALVGVGSNGQSSVFVDDDINLRGKAIWLNDSQHPYFIKVTRKVNRCQRFNAYNFRIDEQNQEQQPPEKRVEHAKGPAQFVLPEDTACTQAAAA